MVSPMCNDQRRFKIEPNRTEPNRTYYFKWTNEHLYYDSRLLKRNEQNSNWFRQIVSTFADVIVRRIWVENKWKKKVFWQMNENNRVAEHNSSFYLNLFLSSIFNALFFFGFFMRFPFEVHSDERYFDDFDGNVLLNINEVQSIYFIFVHVAVKILKIVTNDCK